MINDCRPDTSEHAVADIASYIDVARGAHRRAFQQYERATSAVQADPDEVRLARQGLRFQRLYLGCLLMMSDELSGEPIADQRARLRGRLEDVAAIERGWIAKS